MRLFTSNYLAICALVLVLVCPLNTLAFESSDLDNSDEVVLDNLKPVFEYLLTLTDNTNQQPFEPDQILPILDFVASTKSPTKKYSMGSRKGGSSAYYQFDLNVSLKDMLALAYSHKVPSYITAPASIRRAHWIKVDGKQQPFPDLVDALKDISSPVIVKGIEFIENTPDATSGAYYAYQLDRMLILMQHKGIPMLISMSNQIDKSNVGKKGLVLGSDDHWNYLYTGEKGCTKKGLSWADSYMYNSSSIMVYYQENTPVPKVTCGTFKWLKAGWAGINLAQSHHLREGIARFATTFQGIIESPALTDVAQINNMFDQIGMLSTEDLRSKSRLYFAQLTKRYQNGNKLTRKWLNKISNNKTYIDSMSRDEMQAIVSVEYLKHLLGKDQPFDMGFFLPSKALAQRTD